MLRSQQRMLKTDRFLCADTTAVQPETVDANAPLLPIKGPDPQVIDVVPSQSDPENTCCGSSTCCGFTSCCGGFLKWTPKTKYMVINSVAVLIHFICTSAVIVVTISKLYRIPKHYAFVSPIVQLQWTNYALIKVDATSNKCSEVANSPNFISTIPSSTTSALNIFPARVAYPDFMDLFDFSGTTLIQYNHPGNELHLNWMIMSFFALSCIFQFTHATVLMCYSENFPRILHYIEYAFTSPLMIMVMAANVGIKEMFLITSLGAIFFGMNILGMCSEGMMHYAGYVDRKVFYSYVTICNLTHLAGWVLFMCGMIPIWKQFDQVLKCSENSGTPGYAYAALVLESICFFFFGFLQTAGLLEKYWYFCGVHRQIDELNVRISKSKDETKELKQEMDALNKQQGILPANILFKYDSLHALLSITAKVFLAWLLLGPAMSVYDTFLE